MSILVLTLPLSARSGSPKYSYTLSSDGHRVSRHGRTSAALLPSMRAGLEVVALVPARALSWQRVALPPGVSPSNARMRAVLEGLLEDMVLDEPSQLHFALEPDASAGSTAWVAVCDRAWLKGALQELEAAGRPVARVVPEMAPGEHPPSMHFAGSTNRPLLLATGLAPEGAVVTLPLSSGALAFLAAQSAQDEPMATTTESAVAGMAEQHQGHPVALVAAEERALQATHSQWDLAQFDLATSGRTRVLQKASGLLGSLLQAPQWRAARWAGVTLVLAQVLGLNAWAWQERSALATKEAAIRTTLTSTFPQVKLIVDPSVQMEREVAQLRQAGGALAPGDLEPMLAAAAAALGPQGNLSAIEYRPGSLQLRGASLAEPGLSNAASALQAQGYQLNAEGDTLSLRTQGAKP